MHFRGPPILHVGGGNWGCMASITHTQSGRPPTGNRHFPCLRLSTRDISPTKTCHEWCCSNCWFNAAPQRSLTDWEAMGQPGCWGIRGEGRYALLARQTTCIFLTMRQTMTTTTRTRNMDATSPKPPGSLLPPPYKSQTNKQPSDIYQRSIAPEATASHQQRCTRPMQGGRPPFLGPFARLSLLTALVVLQAWGDHHAPTVCLCATVERGPGAPWWSSGIDYFDYIA